MKKEECFYCNMGIQVNPDVERHIFNWYLAGHGESIAEDDEEITALEAEFNMYHVEIDNPEWQIRQGYNSLQEYLGSEQRIPYNY